MGGPIAADTPDYQRGVVNAQKLLAAPSATPSVIVSPPPNTESMILIADQPSSPSDVVWCLGQTSSAYAPVYRLPASNGVNFNGAWIFDVSSVIDSSYEVYYGNGSHTQWYVYADAAARLVVDGSKLTDLHGQQYVIPSLPSVLSGDHPPVELQWGTAGVSNGQNVQGGLLASQRYRVFTAQVANFSAAAECELLDSTGDWFFQTSSINPAIFGAWPLTGIPLAAGSPIVARVTGGASCDVSLGFTIEAV